MGEGWGGRQKEGWRVSDFRAYSFLELIPEGGRHYSAYSKSCY